MTEEEFTSELLKMKNSNVDENKLCHEMIPIGMESNFIGFDGDSLCNELVNFLLTDSIKKSYLVKCYNDLLDSYQLDRSKEELLNIVMLHIDIINLYGDITNNKNPDRMLNKVREAASKCGIIISINL